MQIFINGSGRLTSGWKQFGKQPIDHERQAYADSDTKQDSDYRN
jgi:hypothetical protein